jgi:hypothetical protein
VIWKKRLACSFCGRGEKEVEKLVAGPRVYICDRCVAIASRMMNEVDGSAVSARLGLWRSVWNRVRLWMNWGSQRRSVMSSSVEG